MRIDGLGLEIVSQKLFIFEVTQAADDALSICEQAGHSLRLARHPNLFVYRLKLRTKSPNPGIFHFWGFFVRQL